MNFDEYQKLTATTAVYPGSGGISGLTYAALGLNGEAGEVADKVKKLLRDHNGNMSHDQCLAIVKELGDVLWYLSQMCSELRVPMSYVADLNINKLRDRAARAAIRGEGDER